MNDTNIKNIGDDEIFINEKLEIPIRKKICFNKKNLPEKIKYYLCERKNLNTLRCRFQKLAGIHKNTVAILKIDDNTIEFKTMPSLLNIIRYKIAGFKIELLNNQKGERKPIKNMF